MITFNYYPKVISKNRIYKKIIDSVCLIEGYIHISVSNSFRLSSLLHIPAQTANLASGYSYNGKASNHAVLCSSLWSPAKVTISTFLNIMNLNSHHIATGLINFTMYITIYN